MTALNESLLARYGPWAVIAGASDGIGEAFARHLAAAGLNLLLLARRGEVLARLAGVLSQEHGVEVRSACVDLTAAGMMDDIVAAARDIDVGLLVYNAGASHGAANFLDKPVAAALGMVDLNCRGPVLLAHHFGGAMRARGRGGIMLLSSLAALSGGSNTASYNASKSFDLILAEGLWHELKPCGVDAMCLLVGATRTPSMLSSCASFADYPGLMEPADVAAEGLALLGRGPVGVAGAHNRAVVKAMLPVSRVAAINALSAATAGIYGLAVNQITGEDPA
jgi:uncharacterized protein